MTVLNKIHMKFMLFSVAYDIAEQLGIDEAMKILDEAKERIQGVEHEFKTETRTERK